MSDVEKQDVVVENQGVEKQDQDAELSSQTSSEKGHVKVEAHLVEHVVHGDDEALKFVGEVHGKPVPPEIARSIRWKADLLIATFISFAYGLNFADKIANSAGATMGLTEDVNMPAGSNKYSWQGTAFYLGYLVFELPISRILLKFPIAKSLGVLIIIWGTVTACTAASQTFPQFIALRTLLGGIESCVTPGFIVITTQFYTKDEHFSRSCLWLAWNGVGNILASSIAYGLLQRGDSLPLHGWRLLLIILGSITVFYGIIFVFHVPDNPGKAWFFTEKERMWQVERIRQNMQGYGSKHFKWYQVGEALWSRSATVFWITCIATFLGDIPNGISTTFQTQLLKGLGYTSTNMQLLMGLPGGAVEFVGMHLTALFSVFIFRKARMVYTIGTAVLSLIFACLLAWCPEDAGSLAGLYLLSWSSPATFVGLISVIESNVLGGTKKLFTSAVFMMCYAGGNALGPKVMYDNEAPGYQTGKTTMAACQAGQLVCVIGLAVFFKVENMRRDRKNEILPPEIENPEFADLTDGENPEFRYAM